MAETADPKRATGPPLADTLRHGRLSRGALALARDMHARSGRANRLRHVVKSQTRD